jgi:hypothetical protein
MKGLSALVIVAVMLCVVVFSGCRSQSPPVADPFIFGPTRVPPPGTGAASGSASDPYYRGSPPTVAPQMSAPGGASLSNPASSSASKLASSNTSPTCVNGACKVGTGGASAALGSATAMKLPQRGSVIQVLQPRVKADPGVAQPASQRSTTASTPGEPDRLQLPTGAVDIMDLPAAGTSSASPPPESTPESRGFRLVSGAEESPESGGSIASDSAGGSMYGHAPDYHWIRGQLEYSQIDRQWKLRYIPVDGVTDDFGGSVVLPDPKVLTGHERGDFLEIRGRVSDQNPEKGYAPTYEVAEVKPLTTVTR